VIDVVISREFLSACNDGEAGSGKRLSLSQSLVIGGFGDGVLVVGFVGMSM
jgi:hypothetical protein